MHSSKEDYFAEKHINGSFNSPCRTSTSGFENPKELFHQQYARNFTTISEEKMPNVMMANSQQSANGAKKNEFYTPNFFSENNINISNQCNSSIRNMMSTSHTGAADVRPNYNDPTSIPRFVSTPLISNTLLDDSLRNNNFMDAKNVNDNYSYESYNYLPNNGTSTSSDVLNQINQKSVESIYQNNQYYQNFANNSSYMPSYMVYDPKSNSCHNVIFVPQVMPMMNQAMNMIGENQYYLRHNNERNMQNFIYPEFQQYSESINSKNQYQNVDNQGFVESNGFSHDLKEKYAYDEQAEIGDGIERINQTEFESLHSLNKNVSGESEEYSSEDDQLNTVHGNEMLEELQKLSSVFTNVVNVSIMSRNSNMSEPAELLNHNNSSRFKKTRIKERTTYWNNQQAIVKDNLVKIIPEEILKIPFIDNNQLDQFESEIFGDQPLKKNHQEVPGDQPNCVHSILPFSSFNEMRIHKHSNRSSQWCRSSTTPLSLNDFPRSSNQLHKPNISRYVSHRKSLQIPIPIPLVYNKFIPVLHSPVIPNCGQAFYEQSNSNNPSNNRRKRRWSVSCSRLDARNSISPRANYVSYKSESPHDLNGDFLKAHPEEAHEIDTPNSFESRIDHHLFCLKRSLIDQFDLSLRDMRGEIKSMKNTQIELESQLSFYKKKLDSIRNSLPEKEWKSLGISDIDLES